MSQFYSDMITWSVVGLGSFAVFLANMPGQTAPPPIVVAKTTDTRPVATQPIVVASVQTDSVVDATPVAVMAQVEPATVSRRVSDPAPVLPQIVEDVVLIDVNFAANGGENGLPPIASPDAGIVTGQSVNLRAGPGTGFQIVSRAARDDALVVTGETDGIWVQVLAPITEQEAWIHGKYFKSPGA